MTKLTLDNCLPADVELWHSNNVARHFGRRYQKLVALYTQERDATFYLLCLAESPDRDVSYQRTLMHWTCTRSRGHSGPHIAGYDRTVCAIWHEGVKDPNVK